RRQADRDQNEKRDEGDETADHENIAVGEIDHADDAVDHRVADGDQAIDRTEHQSVDELLGEVVHRLPCLSKSGKRGYRMYPNLLRLSCDGVAPVPESTHNNQHVEGSGSRIVASSHFLTAGTGGGNHAGCGFGPSSTPSCIALQSS